MNTEPKIQLLPHEKADVLPQDWGELTWYANRELGNSNEVTVGRCLLHPGQSNPRHYHPNCHEILTVFSGQIRHTLEGDQTAIMREGDTVSVAPNVWHQATNIGDSDAILIIVFTSAERETVGE